MNILKKVFPVVLIAAMLMSVLCTGVAVSASTPATQTIKAAAGETVTLRLTESDCYGISGSITYSNRDLFSSVTPGNSPYGRITDKSFILSSSDKIECDVILTAKISDTAAVGSTCVVKFTDYLRVENNVTGDGPEGLEKTVTVEVVKKETTTTTKKPTTSTTTTTKKPTTTTKPLPTTTAKPQKPADGKLDLTALNKQIGIAEGLTEADYTADSWANMQTALDAAKAARSADTQTAINKAANDLKNAIAALVRVDGDSLLALIQEAKSFLGSDQLSALRDKLIAAIEQAEAAVKSGDKDAIAQANTALAEALAAYKAKLAELGKDGIDSPTEVLPDGNYCNIWLHKLWPILLIVSFIINLGFVGLTVYYFVRRKKNMQDDTPLIDYDINDD